MHATATVTAGQPVLAIHQVSMSFLGLKAVDQVSLRVEPGQIIGVIGPNGAGKSTLFNLVSGLYRPEGGDIEFLGERITALPPTKRARRGMARTFQNIRLFPKLTVRENLLYSVQTHASVVAGLLGTARFKAGEASIAQRCDAMLDKFGLLAVKDHKATALPYGHQRLLEIARALINNPKLLLLDEPAAGMNTAETAQLAEKILWIRDTFDVSILLIEHDVKMVKRVCDAICLLNHGRLLASGEPHAVFAQPEVIHAYLG